MEEDTLISKIATELGKSPILARYIAEKLQDDPTVLTEIATKLDAQLIAANIANNVLYVLNTKHRVQTLKDGLALTTMADVMKQATKLAADIVAKEIAAEALHA